MRQTDETVNSETGSRWCGGCGDDVWVTLGFFEVTI